MSFVASSLTSTELATITRLFSPSVVRDLALNGRSPILGRAVKYLSQTFSLPQSTAIGDFFEAAFEILEKKQFRHEYVYKAAITKRILLGRHSLSTSSMLSEFRVGNCKADLVILNGSSTVFEIKSERDNLDRLVTQISEYRKVFANVNVITGEKHLDAVTKCIPDAVGIMLLKNQNRISIARESIDCADKVSPVAIFDSLRIREAIKILEMLGVDAPVTSNILMRQALRKVFSELDPTATHDCMVKVLKQCRSLRALSEVVIDQVPSSLQAAALSFRLRKKECERLAMTMGLSIKTARTWAT